MFGVGAGVVLQTGSNLTNVSAGDVVLLSFDHCGTCHECKDDFPSYCHQYAALNFGGKRPDGSRAIALTDGTPVSSRFFGQSSFAKMAVVSGFCLVQVPRSTDLALFAPLGCGIQTGVGTILNTLDVRTGQSLAVFGVGAVGLAAVMAGKMRGAHPIIAVDLDQKRLDLAECIGASHKILASDPAIDVVQEIVRLCPGNGVNRAVDCTGVVQVIDQMIRSLASRGKAATVGAPPPGKGATIDAFTHIIKGTHYIGSCEGDSSPQKVLVHLWLIHFVGANTHQIIPSLLRLHSEGHLPLEKITTIYEDKDYQQAFEDVRTGKTIKAVIKWK